MDKQIRITESFLKDISKHLSSNPKCRYVEYNISISENMIYFKPYVEVFPDRKHRKLDDKEFIIYHIIKHHYPELLCNNNITIDKEYEAIMRNFSMVPINEEFLIPGEYLYKFSVNKKQRKWVKLTKKEYQNLYLDAASL